MAGPRIRVVPNKVTNIRPDRVTRLGERRVAAFGESSTAKEIREFAETGLYEYASKLLLESNEIEQQKNPPNLPTIFYADRRRQLLTESDAKRFVRPNTDTQVVMIGQYRTWKKIGLFYGQNADIFKGVAFAYDSILKLLRIQTGYSVRGIYFWLDDTDQPSRNKQVQTLVGVRAWLNDAQTSRVTVHIIGPTVPYRRKLIYSPKGSPRGATKKTRALSKGLRGTATDRVVGFDNPPNYGLDIQARGKKRVRIEDTFSVRQALQKLVVRRARARNELKGLWFGYAYLRSRVQLQPDKRGKFYTDRIGSTNTGPYGGVPVIFVAGSLRPRPG